MKNKISILITASSLLLGCAFTLNAENYPDNTGTGAANQSNARMSFSDVVQAGKSLYNSPQGQQAMSAIKSGVQAGVAAYQNQPTTPAQQPMSDQSQPMN